ncbi:MAG: hypothetical protein KG075_10125 [Alphaproteobacteria bacterium]|nr:hypothetical protein [Alphaproteobacteria bacterium]
MTTLNIQIDRFEIGSTTVPVSGNSGSPLQAQRVADLPPEEQAKIHAHLAEAKTRLAQHDRKMSAFEQLIQDMRTGGEVQSRRALSETEATDFSNARPVQPQWVEITPEIQARLDENRARVQKSREVWAEMERQSQELAKGYESNGFSPRSIASLSREQALDQINYVSELIQSGQSENYTLSVGYNGRITSDFRQYLYWIQQHVKELEGASQSTLAQM